MKKLSNSSIRITKEIEERGKKLMVTTLTWARRETMTIPPPTQMRQSSVMSTRLTGNEPSKPTWEMTQSPKKAVEKLTSIPDFLPYTNRKNRKSQESTRTEVGGEQFSQSAYRLQTSKIVQKRKCQTYLNRKYPDYKAKKQHHLE